MRVCFWFVYAIYVFDFFVLFGPEIVGILTVCGPEVVLLFCNGEGRGVAFWTHGGRLSVPAEILQ